MMRPTCDLGASVLFLPTFEQGVSLVLFLLTCDLIIGWDCLIFPKYHHGAGLICPDIQLLGWV